MKKMMITICFALVLVLSGCNTKNDNEVLTILTSSGYAPYEMVDTDGNLTGFDIELMEALAQEAGIEIEWLDVDFNGILASLESGTQEVAIAGITPTAERTAVLDFSEIYYNSEAGVQNYLVFQNKDNYLSLEDLDGLVIGAQLGTIQAELLTDLSEEYHFTVDFRTAYSQIIEEIKINTVDALLVENLVADSILKVNTDFVKAEITTSLDTLYGNAIAFTRGSEYKTIFDAALVTLSENGVLDALIAKWFVIE